MPAGKTVARLPRTAHWGRRPFENGFDNAAKTANAITLNKILTTLKTFVYIFSSSKKTD